MKIAYGLVAVGYTLICGALICQVGPPSAYADETPADADTPPNQGARARYFDAHIAPLLARHCLQCHGPTTKKGRLNLSRKDTALAGGRTGKAIVPGKPAESLLWEYVKSDRMPPEKRPRLSRQEKQLLRQWIDAGAIWSADKISLLPFADERIERHQEFKYTSDVRGPGPILLRRLTVPEYVETVRSAVGVDVERDARKLLPPDVRADGFSNTAYNLTVDLGNVKAYARLAEIIVERMDVAKFAARYSPRPTSEVSKTSEVGRANMRKVISGMGKWLLRGPLQEREISSFLQVSKAVAGEGGDFTEVVSYVDDPNGGKQVTGNSRMRLGMFLVRPTEIEP